MQISVVIPAFEEEGNIGRLIEETFEAVPEQMLGEVIVVDDASKDGTGAEILELTGRFPKLRYLRHDRQSGQSAGMRTGIRAARFPVIATMDGDGQNDPHDIPKLAEKLGEPGDTEKPALVGGWRTSRKDTGSKRMASRMANKIRDSILKDECPDTGCGIKVYWRDAFLQLPYFTSMHRYLPALFQSYGFKTAYEPVNDRPRIAGVSKYNNLNRALVGIYDLIGVSWIRKRTAVPRFTEGPSDLPEDTKEAEEDEAKS